MTKSDLQFLQDARRRVSFPMAYRPTPRRRAYAGALSICFPLFVRSIFSIHIQSLRIRFCARNFTRKSRSSPMFENSRVLQFLLHASSKRSRFERTYKSNQLPGWLFLAKRKKGRSAAPRQREWTTLTTRENAFYRQRLRRSFKQFIRTTSIPLFFPFNASSISTVSPLLSNCKCLV